MPNQVSIIQGTNTKPVSSQALVSYFAQVTNAGGCLYIGYPIIGTAEGRHPIDALWISPQKGIVVFDLVEGAKVGDFGERQDDAANKLESRLKTHRELVIRRDLAIPIHTISVAPAVNDTTALDADYLLANLNALPAALDVFRWEGGSTHYYDVALSALQNISTIRKGKVKRAVQKEDSRGAKLKLLEDSIATLDNLQGKAVIETVEGVQRIRGLAGSGKTIVLALKAAYLHAQHPSWRIAVTFNTRSLKAQFRRLINTFCIEQTGDEPDWERLRIISAWGAPGGADRDGIYYEYCHTNEVPYYDFKSAQDKFGTHNEFAGACQLAINNARNTQPLYDAILIDEAQDFPPVFLRLCYEILNDRKQLVYAYDELQNLSGASLPSPEDIFGKQADGSPRVSFDDSAPNQPRRDIILEKCYRNSRPVLVTAHSLGFGIYRKAPSGKSTGLVQMFDNSNLWEEIGYEVRDGMLRDGMDVVLRRTADSSPSFLEEHSRVDDLIVFKAFESEEEQADWVANEIRVNLTEDELRHDDIVVINPDPISTRKQAGPVRRRLLEMEINSHLAGVDTNPDIFFQPDSASITFTGVFRAKGNEAGMVYIINANDCESSLWNLATIRNRLFTAITRSKAWVRVLGVGPKMKKLIGEYERLREKDFELQFQYPTRREREQLGIVHRDMTASEQKRLKARERGLKELLKDLESGVVHAEDLNGDLISQLEKLLKKKR